VPTCRRLTLQSQNTDPRRENEEDRTAAYCETNIAFCNFESRIDGGPNDYGVHAGSNKRL